MKGQTLHIFTDGPVLIFYELLVSRLPNQKQTACVACPGNLVANSTIGLCWCPFGDLVFNDNYDYCKCTQFSNSCQLSLNQTYLECPSFCEWPILNLTNILSSFSFTDTPICIQ